MTSIGGGAESGNDVGFMCKEHIKYAHWLVRVFKRMRMLDILDSSSGSATLTSAGVVEVSEENGKRGKRKSRKKSSAPQLSEREVALAGRVTALVEGATENGMEPLAALNLHSERVLWLMHHEY
jgi:hypothetical protein